MSKSAMYATNTQSQVLAVGSVVNFGNIIRRFGCNTTLVGGNPVVEGSGYYGIEGAITLTATAAGTVTVTLFEDGVAIPGAVNSMTVVAGNVYQLPLGRVIVRESGCCCGQKKTITAVVSGTEFTATTATVTVEKE